MDDELYVSTAEVWRMAHALEDEMKLMREAREELATSMIRLGNSWEGEAADAAAQLFRDVDMDLTRRANALAEASRHAQQLGLTYERADVNLAKLFGDA